MRAPVLVVLPALPASEQRPGFVRLTKKFVEGMARYVAAFPGEVRVVLHPGGDDQNLDGMDVDRRTAGFEITIVPFDSPALLDALSDATVVLGGPHHLLPDVAGFCRARGIAYVLCTEYSLRTRLQIVRADAIHPLRKLRRVVWEAGEELRTLRQVRRAAALQCNGTPTYELYRHLAKDALLYFDNRVDGAMLATDADLAARLARRASRAPIRLAFSGRFTRMKGADHVVRVAVLLRARGVPFTLDLLGGGDLEAEMREAVRRAGLEDVVRFHGVVDFARELMPFMAREVDLFVCCHRQGDPSCTYVETFAAGVPIAGYANEALAGLLARVPAGVAVPMDDEARLADEVARLAADAPALEAMSRAARAFAADHLFEPTFARRMAQLVRLARRAGHEDIRAREAVA